MKLGLVLEGGASRTYFSCGILDALLDAHITADFVIGTSAGIANALSYASGQIGRNIQVADTYVQDHRYMGIRHLLNPKNRSYYNLEFIFDTIPNTCIPFDFEAFARFKGDVVATVTNLNTGKTEYLPVPKQGQQDLVLMASCALPLMFPVVTIAGQPYMDGGITMPVPIDEALREGCDKLIVILTRERGYMKHSETLMRLAARLYNQYPKFSEALRVRTSVYNENIRHVYELEAAGKAFVITPHSTADIKRTEADPEKLDRLYHEGYQLLMERLDELKTYLAN